jgi:hypothetical protein
MQRFDNKPILAGAGAMFPVAQIQVVVLNATTANLLELESCLCYGPPAALLNSYALYAANPKLELELAFLHPKHRLSH